jgi:hypothetical protein
MCKARPGGTDQQRCISGNGLWSRGAIHIPPVMDQHAPPGPYSKCLLPRVQIPRTGIPVQSQTLGQSDGSTDVVSIICHRRRGSTCQVQDTRQDCREPRGEEFSVQRFNSLVPYISDVGPVWTGGCKLGRYGPGYHGTGIYLTDKDMWQFFLSVRLQHRLLV